VTIWDISEVVDEATAVFPGDTPFTREWVATIEGGAPCNVSTIRMSVHCGTHTDAPLHYDATGKAMADVSLSPYLGRCRVVTVAGEGTPAHVPVAALTPERLEGVERILFHTCGDHDRATFDPGFTAVGPEAAERLVSAGVVLVGIDTPSIDHATSQDLPGHQVLNRGGVAILENIDLTGVPDGDYELIALPLRIGGSDSSPVRAILRTLD